MKLIEIANFLNGRERQFVQEKAGLEKKLKKQDGELRKAHADLRELDVSFEAYKDKYQLQLELTRTLEEREREADKLAEEKRILEGKVAELEGQLQKLAIPDEEERNEDPSGSLLTCLGEH
jgi:protein subunit release factor A